MLLIRQYRQYRQHKRLVFLSAIVLLIQACTTPAPAGRAQLSGAQPIVEQLIASPPDGWHRVFKMNNTNTRISDFVPIEESDINWNTKISFESFASSDFDLDPIEILLSEVEQDRDKCNFVQHFNLFSGRENNYETSVRLFLCGKNEFVDKGEVKLVKAIRGDEYFYTIRLIRRLPPFEVNQPDFAGEEIAIWSTYLKQIYLCNNAENHPCHPNPTIIEPHAPNEEHP